MRIESAEVYPVRLPLKAVFKTSRGAVAAPEEGAPHVYLKLSADDGSEGWGEARPSPRWSYETPESVVTTLRGYLIPAIQGADPSDLVDLHARMDREIAPGITVGQPIAKSAVDMAAHDLVCRAAGVSLLDHLGGSPAREWPVACIVSAESPRDASKKAGEAAALGFRHLKVKIGIDPGDGHSRDGAILRAVREAAPGAYLWADANQAYDLEAAVSLSAEAARIGVDVLEQPLPANAYAGLRELRLRSDVPIALDESVFSPEDLREMIRMEALDALVIKVSKMAGIGPAAECIRVARDHGLDVLGSGLTESRLGFHAALALYAANGVDRCDINGPQFLLDDAATGGPLELSPMAPLQSVPGIGVSIDPDKLARFAAPG